MLLLFNLFQNGNTQNSTAELAYSDFVSSVKSGNIREVTISGNSISATTTGGRNISTFYALQRFHLLFCPQFQFHWFMYKPSHCKVCHICRGYARMKGVSGRMVASAKLRNLPRISCLHMD